MTLAEYNQARKNIEVAHATAMGDPTEANITELVLNAALHGLVIMPIEHLNAGEIPTPICGLISIPTGIKTTAGPATAMHYIFPADQHKS